MPTWLTGDGPRDCGPSDEMPLRRPVPGWLRGFEHLEAFVELVFLVL